MRTTVFVVAAAILFSPPSYAQTSAQPAAQAAVQGAGTGLRLEGSDTVGAVLAPMLVQDYFKRNGFPAIRVVPGEPQETDILAEGAERREQLRASIHSHGSGTGLAPLLAGKADIWMSSRPANAAEAEAAAKAGLGNIADPANEHVIAFGGISVVVHPDNHVRHLTITQIADVFSGKVTRWSDLGGSDLPITLYTMDKKSGTYDTFAGIVLTGGRTLAPSARVFEAHEDVADGVASDPGAIGVVGTAFARNSRSLDIVGTCGIATAANMFNVKTLEYPLSRRLFLYVRGKDASPETRKFIAWVESPDAQNTVNRAGFVGFDQRYGDARYTGHRLEAAADALDGGSTAIREADLNEFEDATAGAVRMSTTFRFQPGSGKLDSQAQADVDRVMQTMRSPEMARAKLRLIGFTQSLGNYAENRAISRERADAVRQALEAHGVAVATTVGVGPASPVACNTDPATRALNQRVEVWVQKQ